MALQAADAEEPQEASRGKGGKVDALSGCEDKAKQHEDFDWLVVWNIYYFFIYWEFHHPN